MKLLGRMKNEVVLERREKSVRVSRCEAVQGGGSLRKDMKL